MINFKRKLSNNCKFTFIYYDENGDIKCII